MKRERFSVCLYLLAFSALTWGWSPVTADTANEKPLKPHHDHTVNFGVKGGFTSSLFLVSNFSVNGTAIDEVQNNYKIGYFGSLFIRINFDRHFLQPEISYNVNRCNITFEKPLPTGTPPEVFLAESSITSTIHSIDIPVIYGYNFIKEGPYNLAAFGGPKIRYIQGNRSDVSFENFDQLNIREELRPLNLSLTVGVAVTISRIFFDFRYDIGLHNISKRVSYEAPTNGNPAEGVDPNHEIHFHRRDNVLSFSLGVFF